MRSKKERDEADRKWKAQRDSGYKGPVDHNGNRVKNLDKWIADQMKRGNK